MKLKLSMTLLSLIVLTSGCAKISGDSYCDITSPLFFESERTIDWLIENDRGLLSDIMVSNETFERVCDADL